MNPIYTSLNIHAAAPSDLLKMLDTIKNMLEKGFESGQVDGTGEIHGRHEGAVCHGWFVAPEDTTFEEGFKKFESKNIPDSPDLPPVEFEDSSPPVIENEGEYDHLAEAEQLKALIQQIQKQCPGSIIVLGLDKEESE